METMEGRKRSGERSTDADQSGSATATVLLVDDNEDGRAALRALLEALGYGVVEAGDGFEALELAGAHHPDLILMDLMMPRLDGLEATRRIRSTPPLADVPIICLSAMEGAEAASLEAGCDACIIKPIYDLSEFGRQISAWMRQD